MKNVKFKIRELGAIRDAEITLKPLMLFSGESGVGKSYLAFLVHYLYVLMASDRLEYFFKDLGLDFEKMISAYPEGGHLVTVTKQQLSDWMKKDAITYIGYLIGHSELKGEVAIDWEWQVKELIFSLDVERSGVNGEEETYYKITLGSFVYKALADTFQLSPTPFAALTKAMMQQSIFGEYPAVRFAGMLPPSRGSLMETERDREFTSGMYYEFFDLKNFCMRPLKKPEEVSENIKDCLNSVNAGRLEPNNNVIKYVTDNGISMPLSAAASSVKELAPLTLLLNKYSTKGLSLLFEEPEAHLHPDRQVKIADLIACSIGQGAQMQITSHSDFFIKRLNVLMNLYRLYNSSANSDGKVEELMSKWGISKEWLLDPSLVGAYVIIPSDNGCSQVKENSSDTDGISYETFYATVERDLTLSQEIRQLLNDFNQEPS
ncbi:MAG: AAA family ATPase [Bacteroidales bacterium]|nr:AAA family ATPase [Bacteroidales bacterium]